jgi:hypothetical protein
MPALVYIFNIEQPRQQLRTRFDNLKKSCQIWPQAKPIHCRLHVRVSTVRHIIIEYVLSDGVLRSIVGFKSEDLNQGGSNQGFANYFDSSALMSPDPCYALG